MDLITKDARNKERRGVKLAVVGESGVGKTSLLFSLPAKKTVFIDLEAGDLAVDEWDGMTLRPRTWNECIMLAALVGGPNPSLPDHAAYSQKHFDSCRKGHSELYEKLQKFEYVFVDSLTHTGRLSFQKSSNNYKDGRKAYGEHGQNMIKWLNQLQQARHMHIIFLSILNKKNDDDGIVSYSMQIEGAKTGEELPGIVDELITMAIMDRHTIKPYRAFVCQTLNQWGYPAKDRAGKLDEKEKPHLGELIEKLKRPRTNNLIKTLNFELPPPPEKEEEKLSQTEEEQVS